MTGRGVRGGDLSLSPEVLADLESWASSGRFSRVNQNGESPNGQDFQDVRPTSQPVEGGANRVVDEISAFIAENRAEVVDGLREAGAMATFLLIGEWHLPGAHEEFRAAIANSLPGLKADGYKFLVVELGRQHQPVLDSLDPADPHLREKIRAISPPGWQKGNTEIVARGIELGFKIVCPDLDKRGMDQQLLDSARFEKRRDVQITEYILGHVPSGERAVAFYGNAHIHKQVCESIKWDKVTRFGTLLARIVGDAKVVSVRFCDETDPFNGLDPSMTSCPTVRAVASGTGVFLLPDRGPVAGDKRVTAADYIIVDSNRRR
jgi:hypothetical protein